MTRPLPPAKVAAYIKAALKAGLKVGEFDVRAVGDEVTILTHGAASPLGLVANDQDWVALAGEKDVPGARRA